MPGKALIVSQIGRGLPSNTPGSLALPAVTYLPTSQAYQGSGLPYTMKKMDDRELSMDGHPRPARVVFVEAVV